jgi:ferritin-like metal-binding protein YciE
VEKHDARRFGSAHADRAYSIAAGVALPAWQYAAIFGTALHVPALSDHIPSARSGVTDGQGRHRPFATHNPLTRTRRNNAMGIFSKDIKTMDDLFVHTLQDIYYAENQILKALPEMIDKASDARLKETFRSHLEETKRQVERLKQVFRMHGAEVKGVDCPAIDGIIEEADDVAGEVADKAVLDAALIAAAQAVEHYEITRYGTLIAWAKQLGRNDCASVLQQTIDEEKAADKKLTGLAEQGINSKAA